MNRTTRGMKTAKDAARMSTHSKYRVGAAIYLGNRLISVGWNNHKTSPENSSIFRWHHAETSALIGLTRKDLSRATIYIIRINKAGNLKMAKPCEDCQSVLRAAGIRKVFYTDRSGKLKKL